MEYGDLNALTGIKILKAVLMSQGKVKGVMLIDYVRMIRANKGLPWEEYLTKEDMDIVNAKIFPSSWYSVEIMERMGQAVFLLIGKGDLEMAKIFGEITIQDTFHDVYKDMLFDKMAPVDAPEATGSINLVGELCQANGEASSVVALTLLEAAHW